MANPRISAAIGQLPQSGGPAVPVFSNVQLDGLPANYDFNGTELKFQRTTGDAYRLSLSEGDGLTLSSGTQPTISYNGVPIGVATTVANRLIVQFNRNAAADGIEAVADHILLTPAKAGTATAPHYTLSLEQDGRISADLPYVSAAPGVSATAEERSGGGILVGSTAGDTFIVNTGTISFVGGDGNDTLQLAHALSGPTALDLRVTTAQTLGTSGPTVTLSSVENVSGFVNLDVTGTDGANRISIAGGTIHALDGDDQITSGSGTVDGGAGNDTLYTTRDIDLRSSGLQSGLRLISIENLVSTEAGEEPHGSRFTGTSGDNLLVGGSGDDVLIGNGGADRLVGGLGSNQLDGGGGDDVLVVTGQGRQLLDGGSGSDTLDLSGIRRQFAIALDLTVKTEQSAADGAFVHLTLSSIENLIGNEADNVFRGSGAENRLEGRGGFDTLNGRGGDDVLDGGAGDDTLDGGSGDDVLIGGAGIDKMRGGTGADIFRFLAAGDSPGGAGTRDVLQDFDEREDRIDLAALAAGGQQLRFIGAEPFHRQAGEVHFVRGAAATFVAADLDGDGRVDFEVTLAGLHMLTAANFDFG